MSPIVGQPGYYRLMGRVEANSDVFARNRRTDLNSGQFTSSGVYDFVVQGEEGDQMELWYIVGSGVSPRVAFLLPPDENGAGGAGGAP